MVDVLHNRRVNNRLLLNKRHITMKKVITGTLLAGLPMLVMAQANAFSVLGVIGNIMRILIPLLVTAALLYFIWGVIQYVIAKNTDDTKEAKNIILRGVVGLVAITTIWGLVGFVQSTFGFGSGGQLNKENIPGVSFN